VEPSKKLAEMVNNKAIKDNGNDENDVSRNDSDLININEESSGKNNSSING
jgi:hypothetical protein